MTPGGVFTIAWHRRAWIAAPVLVTAGAAALIGWGLRSRATYRASVLLAVTESAGEGAVFALKTPAVLEGALERAGLGGRRSLAELSGAVAVKVLAGNQLRLDVEAGSGDEAVRLAMAIADEAAATVSALAETASEPHRERVRDLKLRERSIGTSIGEAGRELSRCRTSHEFVTGPQGDLVSASRGRLAQARQTIAARRRDLAAIDAEIEALRQRLADLSGATEEPGASAPVERPLDGVGRRIEAIDKELVRLRENLTDAHPRVATLLAERALLDGGRAVAAGSKRDTRMADVQRELRAKEGERLRASSVISALEREARQLEAEVKTEGVRAEANAREILQRLAGNRAELERVRRLVAEAEDKAERNRASRAALSVVGREKVKAYPTGGGPPPLGLAAAGTILGLMLGGLLAALAESLDPVIRSHQDVVRHLELPVLATISCPAAYDRGRATSPRLTGTALWLLAFLVAASAMVLLVYPGWRKIRAMLRTKGATTMAPRTPSEPDHGQSELGLGALGDLVVKDVASGATTGGVG
ncbi:MAG: GumC domain-containing protein [Planctomycetota bacterium]|jgi:hypothetical protein